MMILPCTIGASLNNADTNEDFPAPVLPTIPTYNIKIILKHLHAFHKPACIIFIYLFTFSPAFIAQVIFFSIIGPPVE